MEKSVIRDEPAKAGTRKIGGQTISAKETSGGDEGRHQHLSVTHQNPKEFPMALSRVHRRTLA